MTRPLLLCLLLLSFLCGCYAGNWRESVVTVENGTIFERDDVNNFVTARQPSGREFRQSHATSTGYKYPSYQARPSQANGETNTTQTREKRGLTKGWIVWFWLQNTIGYKYFTGQWNVPASPTVTNGGTVYFFNSFQAFATNADIIQPVLQWNQDASHPGWYVASWWVITNPAGDVTGSYQSTPYKVWPGDLITGEIVFIPAVVAPASQAKPSYWRVNAYVNGILRTTLDVQSSTLPGGDVHNTAQWTLEAYNIPDCAMLPSSNHLGLSNIVIKDFAWSPIRNPSWVKQSSQTNCAVDATTYSSPPVYSTSPTDLVWTRALTLLWSNGGSPVYTPVAYYAQDTSLAAGYDITPTVSAGSPLACAQICDNTPACQAWAHVPTSVFSGVCSMKSATTSRVNNNGWTSNYKTPTTQGLRSGTYDIYGSPRTLSSTATRSTCAAYCNGEAGCQSWGWEDTYKLCHMYTNIGTAITNGSPGQANGVKGIWYTDRWGSDLSGYTQALQWADATQCASVCQTTTGCTGWVHTMNKPGCDSPPLCYLKSNGIPLPNTNNCFQAGDRS